MTRLAKAGALIPLSYEGKQVGAGASPLPLLMPSHHFSLSLCPEPLLRASASVLARASQR